MILLDGWVVTKNAAGTFSLYIIGAEYGWHYLGEHITSEDAREEAMEVQRMRDAEGWVQGHITQEGACGLELEIQSLVDMDDEKFVQCGVFR